MRRRLLLTALMALGSTSCGQGVLTAGSHPGTDRPDLLCDHVRIDRAALEAGRPASDLEVGRDALRGHQVPEIGTTDEWRDIGDPGTWTVVEESADEVVLVRPLAEGADHEGGSHELLALEHLGTGNPDGVDGWQLMTSGRCDLRTDLGRLGQADLALDPEAPPGPDSTQVVLLVTEHECASGRAATGRIQVVETAWTERALSVVLGVEPAGGSQACPGNPPTPFTLELDRPLGNRTIVDATVHPPRPVTVEAGD